jgi:hypothetical protein
MSTSSIGILRNAGKAMATMTFQDGGYFGFKVI